MSLINDRSNIVNQKCPLDDSSGEAIDLGSVLCITDVERFVRRVACLREKGVSKTQCKGFMFEELEKRLDDEGMVRPWAEWGDLIEVVYGNGDLNVDYSNPVFKNIIEIIKKKFL